MARSKIKMSAWRLSTLAMLLVAAIPTQALYFYMDGSTPRCFHEELPKDTLVVGDFTAEPYDDNTKSYNLPANSQVGIHVTVDETFDNDHRVVSQRAPAKGRFTFSAQDSGDHKICFTASNAPAAGWLSGGVPSQGGVKFHLDMGIGETSKIESEDRGKVEDIVKKVQDLNGRLQDIRREQVFQRVSRLIILELYQNLEHAAWLSRANKRHRSEKQSSEISQKPSMVEWCDGRSFSSWSLE
ncbi:MAG: hypothetical protein Q9159_007591 [Coniocarpon cinnabarinum]